MATLGFRIDEGERPDWPNVTVLIDGDDLIGAATAFIGFDPSHLFDSDALVPTEPPRRVAIYRCNCGEAGCGCAAPIIERSDDVVRWRDFRDFVGVYVRPTTEANPSGGKALPIGDLEFDAGPYLDAVRRATADRSWETRARRLARLMRDTFSVSAGWWDELGWRVTSVSPGWKRPDVVQVFFRKPHGQYVVEVPIVLELSDEDVVVEAASRLAVRDDLAVVADNDWPERP